MFYDVLLREPTAELQAKYPVTPGKELIEHLMGVGEFVRVRVDARHAPEEPGYYLSAGSDSLPAWMAPERTDYARIDLTGPGSLKMESFMFEGALPGLDRKVRRQVDIWVDIVRDFTKPGRCTKISIHVDRQRARWTHQRQTLTMGQIHEIATHVRSCLTQSLCQVA